MVQRKMKVLMLTWADWANTGWRFSKCLETLGIDVTFYKGVKHHFDYPEQGKLRGGMYHRIASVPCTISDLSLKKEANEADVVHFIASTFVVTGADLWGKKAVVQHGGSTYRKNSPVYNEFFNQFIDATVIQSPDLLSLGAKNPTLIYYPVDTDFIKPKFKKVKDKLRIGHFPTAPLLKGTQKILPVVTELSNVINYVGIKSTVRDFLIPWKDNLERMGSCDVIIETMNACDPEIRSGEWGNMALEAASLGKIVITNTLAKDVYEKEYGELPLLIANDPGQLKQRLEELLAMSSQELLDLSHKMRQWAESSHSIQATGKRLWNKIYKSFSNGCD